MHSHIDNCHIEQTTKPVDNFAKTVYNFSKPVDNLPVLRRFGNSDRTSHNRNNSDFKHGFNPSKSEKFRLLRRVFTLFLCCYCYIFNILIILSSSSKNRTLFNINVNSGNFRKNSDSPLLLQRGIARVMRRHQAAIMEWAANCKSSKNRPRNEAASSRYHGVGCQLQGAPLFFRRCGQGAKRSSCRSRSFAFCAPFAPSHHPTYSPIVFPQEAF